MKPNLEKLSSGEFVIDDVRFDEVEIMEFTGLKDKNGVDIYEGDICIVDEGLSDYWYVVEWVYGGFQAVTYKKKGSNVIGISDGVNSFYIEPNEASVMTVIGNIYENQELLN